MPEQQSELVLVERPAAAPSEHHGLAAALVDDAVAVEQVSEVYSTSGQYDLLMKCYLDDKTDIGHFVTSRIQTLAGVKDTFTLITFKAFA